MAHRISLYDGSGWVSDDEEDIVQNRDELADNHSQINAIQDSSTLDSSTLASPRSLRRSNAVRIASTSKRDNNNTTSTPTIAMASSANTTTNETITTAEAATRREISPIRRIPGHVDLIAVAAMQPHYGIAAVAAADVPLTPKTPRKSSFVAPALGNSPEKKRVKFRRFLHRINRGLEKAIRPFRLKSKKQKAAEAELEQIRKTKEAEYEKLQSERLAADKNIAATTENVKPDTAKPVVNNPLPAAPVTDKQLPEVPLDDSFEENMFPQDMIQQVAEHRQYSQSSFEAVALAGVERNVYTMATDVPVLPKSSGGADIVTLEADSAIKNAVLQTDNAQRNSVDDTLTAEAEVINDTLTPEAEVINETPAVETENGNEPFVPASFVP